MDWSGRVTHDLMLRPCCGQGWITGLGSSYYVVKKICSLAVMRLITDYSPRELLYNPVLWILIKLYAGNTSWNSIVYFTIVILITHLVYILIFIFIFIFTLSIHCYSDIYIELLLINILLSILSSFLLSCSFIIIADYEYGPHTSYGEEAGKSQGWKDSIHVTYDWCK